MISDYLNINLEKELGLDKMPEEKREKMNKQMNEVVASRVNAALLARMNDEQKEEFGQVLDDDGDIKSFIQENVPNAQMIAAEVVAEFKQEMLELRGQISDAVAAKKGQGGSEE